MFHPSSYDPFLLHRLRHEHPNLHPNHIGLVRIAHATSMHDLDALDRELEDLAARRREVLARLHEYRQRLWPGMTGRHHRKTCRLEDAPMPPAAVDAEPLWGGDLRRVMVAIIKRHGAISLRELHGLIHRYGYQVCSGRPVQRLGDAAAFEVRKGRLERVDRGVYGPGPVDHGSSADLLDRPLIWAMPGSEARGTTDTAVDPSVAVDPERWSRSSWPPTAQLGGEWCEGSPDPFVRELAEDLDATVAAARRRVAEAYAAGLGTPPPAYDPTRPPNAWRKELEPSDDPPSTPDARPDLSPPPINTLGSDSSTNRSPIGGAEVQGDGEDRSGGAGSDWRDGEWDDSDADDEPVEGPSGPE